MKHYYLLFLYFATLPFQALALNCEWWQTKVKTHAVKQHERGNSKVAAHERIEHCREKWKSADKYVKQFNNTTIEDWPHKSESFKKWRQNEIKQILEILSELPAWAEVERYNFSRATTSISKENPTTSELANKSIVFYDLFFKKKNKSSIIVHEVSHHLYQKLNSQAIVEFLELSEWTIQTTKDGKIFELPPKKTIKPDSFMGKDEDFANHVESYFENPKNYKSSYPKLYDFFQKRYPL